MAASDAQVEAAGGQVALERVRDDLLRIVNIAAEASDEGEWSCEVERIARVLLVDLPSVEDERWVVVSHPQDIGLRRVRGTFASVAEADRWATENSVRAWQVLPLKPSPAASGRVTATSDDGERTVSVRREPAASVFGAPRNAEADAELERSLDAIREAERAAAAASSPSPVVPEGDPKP